ncbi:hypothetical protein [Oxynema sp. CENA135]|nr:hypothetical protein [Oxynema sp. CENA135]
MTRFENASRRDMVHLFADRMAFDPQGGNFSQSLVISAHRRVENF